MFGKMKKMLKDEEGTGILTGLAGAIAGAIMGCCPGGAGALICLPCTVCCPQWCLCPAGCGAVGVGALGGALGGVGGVLFDYVACIGTTMSACFGSVASCINCIPSLMGGK